MRRLAALGERTPRDAVILGPEVELDVVSGLRPDDVGLEAERGLRDGLDDVGLGVGARRGDREDGERVAQLHRGAVSIWCWWFLVMCLIAPK